LIVWLKKRLAGRRLPAIDRYMGQGTDRGQPCALTLGGGKIEALQRSEKLKQEKWIAHAAPKSGREKPSGSERKSRRELRRKDLALDLTGGKSNPAQNQERKFRATKILGWQLGHGSRK
jgi:hypothetical protein